MSFTISSVSPDTIASDGGHEITVTGAFEAGHRYEVYMGDLGTIDDPICYSGKPGQAGIVYPKASTLGGSLNTLIVYSPRVNPDTTAYSIVVMDYDTMEAHLLTEVITAVPRHYFTSVYAMRRTWSPDFKTGPRIIDNEKPT
jgi:hypothetical protein